MFSKHSLAFSLLLTYNTFFDNSFSVVYRNRDKLRLNLAAFRANHTKIAGARMVCIAMTAMLTLTKHNTNTHNINLLPCQSQIKSLQR